MKLLTKNAEDRYQSAFGLKADLTECQRQWQADQIIREFPLGQKDASDRFQISQALFGREDETLQLLTAFENARNGACEVVVITGDPGICKSSLVNVLHVPVAQHNGTFISGRYLETSSTPYSALIDALRSLIQQLLSESEDSLAETRKKIQEAIGVNGQVIVSMLPEAERVLGPQPPLQPLSAEEEQNRFNLTLQNFIESFLSPDRPLVLFLDDIHWGDYASGTFLQRFAASHNLHHLLIVGSTRVIETAPDHPLNVSLQQFVENGNRVSFIALKPLQLEDLKRLLSQSLNCPLEKSSPLAEIVLARTGGNPFFVNEFLRALNSDGLIQFDMAHGGWEWDLAQVQKRRITDNAVDLMAGRIRELPDATGEVLKLAACIGYEFDLSTLAALSRRTRVEIASALRHSLTSGVILPLTQNYLLAEQAEADSEVRYSFSHVGIQQGVYNALPESERGPIHWQIGQFLLREIPELEREQRIFELVNHLNIGAASGQSAVDRLELAQLCLSAGQKAQASAAHEAAYRYLKAGLGHLSALPKLW